MPLIPEAKNFIDWFWISRQLRTSEDLKNCMDASSEITHPRCKTGNRNPNQQKCFAVDELDLVISNGPDPMWIFDQETLAFLGASESGNQPARID